LARLADLRFFGRALTAFLALPLLRTEPAIDLTLFTAALPVSNVAAAKLETRPDVFLGMLSLPER
jgi:hypothetical protein